MSLLASHFYDAVRSAQHKQNIMDLFIIYIFWSYQV